jgi:hypothetical protein
MILNGSVLRREPTTSPEHIASNTDRVPNIKVLGDHAFIRVDAVRLSLPPSPNHLRSHIDVQSRVTGPVHNVLEILKQYVDTPL